MKKIYMRHKNDCMTCCLAMMLNLDYEEVPRFFDDDNNEVGEGYLVEVAKFLETKGMQTISLNNAKDCFAYLKGALIVGGPSATPEFAALGIWHAVIYLDGKLWCDPKGENYPEIDPEQLDLLIPIIR